MDSESASSREVWVASVWAMRGILGGNFHISEHFTKDKLYAAL